MNAGSPVRQAILRTVAVAGAIAGFVLFFRFPDLDISLLGIGAHRNFLFHSAVVPVALAASAWRVGRKKAEAGVLSAVLLGLAAGCGIAIGIHLAADVFQSHPVKFPFVGSLVNGTSLDDRLWLGGNALAGFAVAAATARRAVRAWRRGHGG